MFEVRYNLYMKKFFSNKRLIPEAIALLVILGFVNSVGAISLSNGGLAQVFGTFSGIRPETRTYYVQDNNFGASEGLIFKQNKVVTVTACGAGGGGGGGGRGSESGSNIGAGGGGGGGGGKGFCITKNVKVRAGDILHWNVGAGGAGGVGGEVNQNLHVTAYANFVPADTSPTNGTQGGESIVSINGTLIIQAVGGNGGQAGTNASGEYLPGIGGAGGSSNPALAGVWGHAGENGQNEYMQDNNMGSGGYGGNGEGQGGILSNRGSGGSSWGTDPHGGSAGAGLLTSGGGGGGGGAGRWEDYIYNQNDTANFDNIFGGTQVDSIRNHGGNGGNGGGGLVQFSW